MDLSSFIQNNLSLLERYLFAPDPQLFLDSEVTLPQERKIFDFLLRPLAENEKEIVGDFRLNENDRRMLINSKIYREIEKAGNSEEKESLIARIKELNPHLSFDFPKPAEIADNSSKGAEIGVEVEKKTAPKFESEVTVQDVVVRALQDNPDNFNKLSNYGLKNLPLTRIATLTEN